LIRGHFPDAEAVGLDLSATLLQHARAQVSTPNAAVTFAEHDLMESLPTKCGRFDAIVSCLAIHHLPDRRKAELYAEAHDLLTPNGVFCDIDCDKQPNKRLKKLFRSAYRIDRGIRDPSDQPAILHNRVRWLTEAGYTDPSCHWSCLGVSLVAGRRAPDDTVAQSMSVQPGADDPE
jgi:tRNA (cmo5U34)-methyltransferase